ncbi:ferric reductase like transmembrane component-domain-containing protein [Dissophora ornata]|nr:ferric reductase like transmembrane component-domain-containing protein [Dissophora ornata]
MIALHRAAILLCLGVFSGWLFADYFMIWAVKISSHYVFDQIDFYWSIVCLVPILLGHFITVWGNYFRAQSQFQRSIEMVTTSTNKKQRAAFWDRHDPTFGLTVKFWCLAGIIIIMNLYWFFLTMLLTRADYVAELGAVGGNFNAVAYGSSQAVLLDTSIILFLVLRRSMFHSLGFTYQELIPLHRWLGVAMFIWATIHGISYSVQLGVAGEFFTNIAFTDKTRGTRDMPGVFAWMGVCTMAFFAIPKFRRIIYPVFLYVHRAGTFVFFIGLIMHWPSMMIWYYMLPGFVLFLVDRFVPKIIQARSISPVAACSLNTDADIIRVKFTSPEPMKPYYPGDYITVQIPGLGQIYHPFTIASYWPEDPYSITLYIRRFTESKSSWTNDLGKLFGPDGTRITLQANVDGVFGDRRHDYLKSETMVIFVAGAAITTFMGLIKAIAAQITASREPLSMQLYLICTFRTRSELHAYGSFLHQITRDPRFTSWLHVQIYVSRPDKAQTLMSPHADLVKNDIQVPSQTKTRGHNNFASRDAGSYMTSEVLHNQSNEGEYRDPSHQRSYSPTSTDQTLSESNRTDVSTPKRTSLSSNSTTLTVDQPMITKPTKSMTYQERSLPTFEATSADSISKKLALFDLLTTALLVAVPLAAWYAMRTVRIDGPSQFCLTTKSKDSWTIFVCQWSYAMAPGLVHTAVMLALGYAGIFVARKVHMRHHNMSSSTMDMEMTMAHTDSDTQTIDDGNWDEGDVVYSVGRMEVRKVIDGFVEHGVGMEERNGLVTVFAGGPMGFVDMVERQVKKSSWTADFHRETWAP